MHKFNFLLLLVVCISATVYPVTSVTRWFSSSFHDLRVTLRRYGHCVGDLAPLKFHNMNEFGYLTHQMREFLNQASYDNEQLANVSTLMDNICRPNNNSEFDSNSLGDRNDTNNNNYPVSIHIDVGKYSDSLNVRAKEHRCRAIDEAMDAMFVVFKRAAYNRSEPLDFSVIQFFPNSTNKAQYYNLTDLINTSWINSETPLESVCNITDSVKNYVRMRTKNLLTDRREQSSSLKTLLDIIDRILDPILGLQRRLYWESNNILERAYSGTSKQLGNLGSALGSQYSRIVKQLGFSTNSTKPLNTTSTSAVSANATLTRLPTVQPNQSVSLQ